MAGCNVVYSGKPNAFLMISELFFRKWFENVQFEQGFIRVFAMRFCNSENVKFDSFYQIFRRAGKVLRKPSLGNAFLMIPELLFRKWLENVQFEQGFIRVFAMRFCNSKNVEINSFYKVFRRAGKVLREPSLGNAF